MLGRKRAEDAAPAPPSDGEQAPFDAKMNAILDEVRVEADRILEDARQRAALAGGDVDEQLADRRQRLLELADALTAKAEAVLAHLDDVERTRSSLDRMVRALTDAADEISFELAAAPLGPRGEAAGEPGSDSGDDSEGRQAAIQMAAAGATRSQVGARLREFTDVGDPTELLDQVFGPATADDARVSWSVRREDG